VVEDPTGAPDARTDADGLVAAHPALLETLLARAPIGIAFLDRELRYLRINEQLAAINGVPVQAHLGRTVREVLPELAPDVEPLLRSVLDTGLALVDLEVETGPVPGEPGRRRFWLISYYPVPDDLSGVDSGAAVRGDGVERVAGVGLIVLDVTERRGAEDAAVRAQQRLAFLAQASLRLSQSLVGDDVLDALTDVLTSGPDRLADWVVVLQPDESGVLVPVRSVHADPALAGLALQAKDTGPIEPTSGAPAMVVHRTGRPVLTAQLGPDELADAPSGLPELIAQLHCGPGMLLPLTVRGRSAGVVSAVRDTGRPGFDLGEQALLLDLCGRAALALDNARLYAGRVRIAGALQQALLPASLPEVPGATLAARYRSAEDAVEVGGDFYDVLALDGDRWLLVIGDVAGRGIDAAGATGLARHTLRALAADYSPAAALDRLNTLLLAQAEGVPERFLTAVAGLLRRTPTGGFRLTLANGGHPPPLLVPQFGPPLLLGEPGTLLGAFDHVQLSETEHELHLGDTLLLYTDGVTETRGANGLFGEDRLISTARACPANPPDPGHLLDCLLQAIDDYGTEPGSDDTGLLALTIDTPRP